MNINKETKASNQVISDKLNLLLSDQFVLFTKTLDCHWNVTGPDFHNLHNYMETSYNKLLKMMDETAERIRVIGHRPHGTINKFNSEKRLTERASGEIHSSNQMIQDLLVANTHICDVIKSALKSDSFDLSDDPGTEDFLASTLRSHEFMAWELRSQLH